MPTRLLVQGAVWQFPEEIWKFGFNYGLKKFIWYWWRSLSVAPTFMWCHGRLGIPFLHQIKSHYPQERINNLSSIQKPGTEISHACRSAGVCSYQNIFDSPLWSRCFHLKCMRPSGYGGEVTAGEKVTQPWLQTSRITLLHLHFVKFLLQMGFHQFKPATSMFIVNWKDVLKKL